MKVAAFFIKISRYFLEDLIFIDESGAVLNLINNYAYSPRGQRSHSPRPTSKGKRISAIGAIAYDKLLSAFCFEGTLNGEVFAYYVKHFGSLVLSVVMKYCVINQLHELLINLGQEKWIPLKYL